ncbi:MAG: VWA domain-containing protein [Bdellovibrionales bacterium]
MLKLRSLLVAGLVASPVFAAQSGIDLRWSYENAFTGQKVKGHREVELKDSSQAMQKSILVVKMSSTITAALADYKATCNDVEKGEDVKPDPRIAPEPGRIPVMPGPVPPRGEQEFTAKCKAEKVKVADTLEKEQIALTKAATRLPKMAALESRKLEKNLEYLGKLAKLIRDAKPSIWGGRGMPRFALEAAAPTMRITTGGAQDAQKFRDMVDSKEIPTPADYQAYGLINEFDLYIAGESCDQLLCVSPVVSIDKAAKKLYMQANMGTNMEVDKFERPPINLAIALDVSGSMSSPDNTKKSRLDWAKDAVRETLRNLVPGQDHFTLVYFSDEARVIWPVQDEARAITVEDKQEILNILDGLKTLGSTNLRAGLDLAYEQVGKSKKAIEKFGHPSFENRVIMITDANLNYGDTDESSAVIEVEKQSRTRGINLTTIGVGMNFFADFINKLSILRGSNYIFAQDGERMLEYFQQFPTLVTPVAYDFVAEVSVDSAKAKLVRVHGVPEVKAEKAKDDLFSISTLFFAAPKTKGGGARILEFDLK